VTKKKNVHKSEIFNERNKVGQSILPSIQVLRGKIMHTAQVKDQKNITDGGLARLYNIQLFFHQLPIAQMKLSCQPTIISIFLFSSYLYFSFNHFEKYLFACVLCVCTSFPCWLMAALYPLAYICSSRGKLERLGIALSAFCCG
jgi:hypothetical protein